MSNLSIISEDIGRARMVQQFWRNGMEEERRNGTERRSTVILDDRIKYKLHKTFLRWKKVYFNTQKEFFYYVGTMYAVLYKFFVKERIQFLW